MSCRRSPETENPDSFNIMRMSISISVSGMIDIALLLILIVGHRLHLCMMNRLGSEIHARLVV